MKDFISIDNKGSVEIIGIKIGDLNSEIEQKIKHYDFERTNKGYSIKNIMLSQNYKSHLLVSFNNDCLSEYVLSIYVDNENEAIILRDKLIKILEEKQIYDKKISSQEKTLNCGFEAVTYYDYTNELFNIRLLFQKGFGGNLNKYVILLDCNSIISLLGKNREQAESKICKLYKLDNQMKTSRNNTNISLNLKYGLKVLFYALLLLLFYLYILNGRYSVNKNGYIVVDKWTQTCIKTKMK